MNALASYPAPVIAAIEGHCMGGGLDLALACHRRIAAPHAVFGHRGAALGLMTGWGGTQRLPRLIGKSRALELFVAAEKVSAARALEIGLVDAIADDPVARGYGSNAYFLMVHVFRARRCTAAQIAVGIRGQECPRHTHKTSDQLRKAHIHARFKKPSAVT